MSNRYKGGVISATPPTTTGGESGTASGAWTLEQQMQAQAAGLWPAQPTGPYIEQVFSTYLYTGTGVALNINNGIDLSTKGGLVWIKQRSWTGSNGLIDTARGRASILYSNTAGAATTDSSSTEDLTSFNSNGFSLGSQFNFVCNSSGQTFTSWTFRKQPKFFDVVTYTGNGSARTIAHNLGSVPGCMIIKDCTNAGSAWAVYHVSNGNTKFMQLQDTGAAGTSSGYWNNTTPTSTEFTIGTNGNVNQSGATYIAYLFAHDAGGFGLTGTDNVISCGRLTANGSATTVDLGFEPQWILTKDLASGFNWNQYDNMSGFFVSGSNYLRANTSAAQGTDNTYYPYPTATGFGVTSGFTNDMIYIAIRRGPMKVPTSGTSVFSPNTANASAGTPIVTNFPVDLSISVANELGDTRFFSDRLRGVNSTGQTANQPWIASNSTGAELTNASIPRGWDNTQILLPPYYAGGPTVWWNFRRAPSTFDEVCYTGNATSGSTQTHNLGVAPEFMIVKGRSVNANWFVYSQALGATKYLVLNDTGGSGTLSSVWNDTSPTSTQFTLGNAGAVNASGGTYVAYLWATNAGVTKVGSYTGTGAAQTINCGFTAGSRFVMIKRTDSTGDWYVWDSARGIIPSNDPYLLINSTAAEVTGTDYVDTTNVGFDVTSTAPAAINANGGTFIFLAIA